MAIFKCKMCGGTLEIKEGESVAVCEYCGTRQTLPKLDDEKRANLYDRANHFRRCNEYDKAMGIYEQILAEDNTDAESYWSLVLCRYGVEYVEDSKTHKRVPTVNRTQFGSVFSDGDYQKALEYADEYQRAIYEEEAKAIDEIQKGILAISQEEEPFDVFICYKETDHNGRRTPDSVLAGDLYHELIEEGFRVFFAKITLEDKLGSAYEPYIFAALNSAKVMVVLGTKTEYFNAAWVKNEWSRYLALIKSGAKKTLIPAYKDMDPYDLPEEFAHLQAQDMSKLGFMQDLIRGIEKLAETDKDEKQEVKAATEYTASGNVDSLLKRVFIFLEDGDFESANTYCERILDIDPENAQAYLGKLMVVKEVRKKGQLADCEWSIEEDGYYQKAIRYGDEAFIAELKIYAGGSNRKQEQRLKNEAIEEERRAKNRSRLLHFFIVCMVGWLVVTGMGRSAEEKAKSDEEYAVAMKLYEEGSYYKAENAFRDVTGYKYDDSQRMILQCRYSAAKSKMGEGDYAAAKEEFDRLGSYKDSKECSLYCIKKANETADVDKIVYFGSYEQDNNEENGKELMQWIVLEHEEDKMLLLSQYGLEVMPYHTKNEAVTWETCSLRKWLNEDFLNTAFSKEEQKKILLTELENKDNDFYYKSVDGGNSTKDYIFFISCDEFEKYVNEGRLHSNFGRELCITSHAKRREDGSMRNPYEWDYWLRSPGDEENFAAIAGQWNLYRRGVEVNSDNVAVRPAIWVKLS